MNCALFIHSSVLSFIGNSPEIGDNASISIVCCYFYFLII